MNKAEIEKRLADIQGASGDSEAAHGMEDSLYEDFIKAIAENTLVGDPSELAKMVLTTQQVNFDRWCA